MVLVVSIIAAQLPVELLKGELRQASDEMDELRAAIGLYWECVNCHHADTCQIFKNHWGGPNGVARA